MRDLILVDTSWVIHRMWWVHKDLQVTLHNGKELKSGHLYGLCRLLKSLTSKHQGADIVLCLDGVAKHGKGLSSGYKANRTASDVTTAFSDLGVMIECALAFKGVKVAFHRDLEADEIIAYLVSKNVEFESGYDRIIVYSSDCDMLQLLALSPAVYVSKDFNSNGTLKLIGNSEYLVEPKYVEKFASCSVEVLPLFRAMVGDSSDNLAGFPRMRKKVAKEIAERYRSVAEIDANVGDSIFPDGFVDFLPKLKMNYEIMKLPSHREVKERGIVPKFIMGTDCHDTATTLFSLYRIKSVSPVETYSVDADAEVGALAVRDEVNSSWKLPNRG